MFKPLAATLTILCTLALGCGDKQPPKSTTTTRTQTTVTAGSESSSSDVTETKTEQADGTKDVETTSKTKVSTPPE